MNTSKLKKLLDELYADAPAKDSVVEISVTQCHTQQKTIKLTRGEVRGYIAAQENPRMRSKYEDIFGDFGIESDPDREDYKLVIAAGNKVLYKISGPC